MGLPLTESNWPFLVVIRSNNVKSSDAFCLNVLMIIYPCPYFLDLLKNIVGIQMFFFRCLMSSLESLLGTYSTEMLRGNTSLKWCGPKSATQISFNHIVTNDEIGFSRYSSWPVLVVGGCSKGWVTDSKVSLPSWLQFDVGNLMQGSRCDELWAFFRVIPASMTEGNLRKSVSFTKILLLTSVPSLYVTLACSVWLVLACRDDMVKLSSSFWKMKTLLMWTFPLDWSSGCLISIFSMRW